ncbi:ferritin-like domain-containing protein [Streptomyces sp. ZYX-F-203]
MSVFDLPRLHFGGVATTHLPTGPRGGLVDLASNTALTPDGRAFPADRPAQEYRDHLDRLGPRCDGHGRPTPDGRFSAATGTHFSGNGHFSVDARVLGVEVRAGEVDTADPVVGRSVDLWGHYNDYLATTVNRARVFDVDPTCDRTTTLMVGRFCFGRRGRSHDVGYMATGGVRGFHPPRWHRFDTVGGNTGGRAARRLPRSVVHQFVVAEEDGPDWFEEAGVSPVVSRLREVTRSAGVGGLVVQFALVAPDPPREPDGPTRWRLRGTVAPWRGGEARTCPAGRLMLPARDGDPGGLHHLTVALTDEHVTLNMITAWPVDDAGAGPGDLELRTARGGRLMARVPREAYASAADDSTGGLVTVAARSPAAAAAGEGLRLVSVGARGPVMRMREREIDVQADEACPVLEHPRAPGDAEHDVVVLVRSFVRGRPERVEGIAVRQFFNPRSLPRHPAATDPGARCSDLETVRIRPGGRDGRGRWSGDCALDTDEHGRGRFTLRGATAGTTRILLATGEDDLPCERDRPGSAHRALDHAEASGHWSGVGYLSVRVLPDDWRLESVPAEEVTFDLVHREVLAYYEHLYAFMRAEVFSLADRCKVETYAKLIWQMCDPRNKAKTYYMPPTRELSEPKARLLLRFLRARQAPDAVVTTVPPSGRRHREITTRDELVRLLREAVSLELAVMLQYLYAAYSVPTHGVGLEYLRRGLWTPSQLRLACGDGGETREEGLRGTLLGIAREEMIHFLLVNNILMAVGEPFHVPRIDFGTVNHEIPVPLDFALERLGPGSLERFTLIERPSSLVEDVRRGEPTTGPPTLHESAYGSLSELYAAIREGLRRIPDLFLVERGRGGGEHHLFLRGSLERRHPDYQLEVDDLAGALFAVDVITEQGEGGVRDPGDGEESHYTAFLRMREFLGGAGGTARGREPWNPSYPVLRNPVLESRDAATRRVTDPDAREVMRLFNRAYHLSLRLMAQHFGEGPDRSLRRSDLMNAAIDMMTGLMRPLAESLVTMPSGLAGATAGPSFELPASPAPVARPDVARRGLARDLDELATSCAKHPLVPDHVGAMSASWADRFRPDRR